MANQFASPNITVKEIDLSGVVPAVDTSTGAFVGDFNWGPVEQPILISNEAGLVEAFGSPSLIKDSSAVDFLSASYFLKYASTLYVTRTVNTNAVNASHAGSATLIKNDVDWDFKKSGLLTQEILAKYPGAAGNSIAVKLCPASTTDTAFASWDSAYQDQFDTAPGSSSYVKNASGLTNPLDEVHALVIDSDGVFSGVPGTVLESFAYLSLAGDAKTPDGTDNFIINVLNNKSNFVRASDITDYTDVGVLSASFASAGGNAVASLALSGGVQSPALDTGDYQTGFDTFNDPENITVDFLIAPSMVSDTDHKTVVDYMVGIAASTRKDCVVVTSPSRNAVLNQGNATDITNAILNENLNYAPSSYLICDNNFLKVYDKYNDQYLMIPAASSTAGLMALTDQVSAPWFSPAGQRRGQYFGVTSLAWNADRSKRDLLYKKGINPIVNLPGQGILLYGDKTKESRPSAFDRINVRRLFLVIERAIKAASSNVLFEFNDEFTRSEFVGIVEPFLREIQGRRGITDFRVVCDETNNTANVIDSNRFVASIFVKPARSINFITLNFVAVRSGVEFEEVTGTV